MMKKNNYIKPRTSKVNMQGNSQILQGSDTGGLRNGALGDSRSGGDSSSALVKGDYRQLN